MTAWRMTSGACQATTVTEGVNKSCAKDERPPQRRLVSTAANEVLYQLSPAPAAKYTRRPRESCFCKNTWNSRTGEHAARTHIFVRHTGLNQLESCVRVCPMSVWWEKFLTTRNWFCWVIVHYLPLFLLPAWATTWDIAVFFLEKE